MDLLANQQIEKFQTQGGADKASHEIREFLQKAHSLNLSNPREFRNLFEGIMNPEVKVSPHFLCKQFVGNVSKILHYIHSNICLNL